MLLLELAEVVMVIGVTGASCPLRRSRLAVLVSSLSTTTFAAPCSSARVGWQSKIQGRDPKLGL